MDYWKRNNLQRKDAWMYLTKELQPDIALLQEIKPPILFDETHDIHYHKNGQKSNWGTAIISKKYSYFKYHFNSYYKGSAGLMCFDFRISNKIILTVINIYGKIDSNLYATTTIHHMLSDLTPILHKQKKDRFIIMGGDFNVSIQWDEKYSGKDPSHKLIFDIIKDLGMINCTKKNYGEHVKTHTHSKSDFPWQNDYVFISKNLEDFLVSCKVHNDQKNLAFSDHYPVQIELDF